jgi:hypothetical protein
MATGADQSSGDTNRRGSQNGTRTVTLNGSMTMEGRRRMITAGEEAVVAAPKVAVRRN